MTSKPELVCAYRECVKYLHRFLLCCNLMNWTQRRHQQVLIPKQQIRSLVIAFQNNPFSRNYIILCMVKVQDSLIIASWTHVLHSRVSIKLKLV